MAEEGMHPSQLSLSDAGVRFIAKHEGFKPNLYNDPVGHCTIGFGHLVHKGPINGTEPAEFKAGLTREQSLGLLKQDAGKAEATIRKSVTVPLTQNQYDALVSFTYNVGGGAFQKSTLLKELNKGNYDKVPGELNKWVRASGKVLPGLQKRRAEEGTYFKGTTPPKVEKAVAEAKETAEKTVCQECQPKEVIPLIFVPGIMGSVLRKRGGKGGQGEMVWNPGSKAFMLWNYSMADASEKRRKVIGPGYFSPDYLTVNGGNEPDDPNRGWDGIYSGYDEIRDYLQALKLPTDLAAKTEVPAYAFGYNWSDDNFNSGKKLNVYIGQIIKKHNSPGRVCKKVILISHSMGGLVSRSACKLHGAEGQVLGIVHGVQPVTGAPVAYWRMKAGFENSSIMTWISAQVLGRSAEEVTALLGNMPGALELLPNQDYQNNQGKTAWLMLHDGTKLPKSNPYQEIYGQKGKYWHAINPAYLNPGKSKPAMDWAKYKELLGMAESFHGKLKLYIHGTCQVFYGTGHPSADSVSFRKLAWYQEATNPMIFGNETSKGEYIARVKEGDDSFRVMLNDPSGDGDGTVPAFSGKALNAPGTVSFGLEHEPAYRNPQAQAFTKKAIIEFCRKK